MGNVYRRPGSAYWWCWWLDGASKRQFASTQETEEARARDFLKQVEREVVRARDASARLAKEVEALATTEAPLPPKDKLTLLLWGEVWLRRRLQAQAHGYADDKGRWDHWVKGHSLAAMPLRAVKPTHVKAFIRELGRARAHGRKGLLAPRTVLHVYGLLRVLFADAMAEELVDESPCTLSTRRKELPARRDKVPTWRASAVFSREEVAALCLTPSIPLERRVLYAVLFLTGMRFGEAADRRWQDWEKQVRPLGRFLVASSFHLRTRKSKETKTGETRPVPVHPLLARVLGDWAAEGWEAYMRRPWKPEDVLLPSGTGQAQRSTRALRVFHKDCDALGLTRRRLHDARRTFISLALADGANPALLHWVTHGAPKGSDAFSLYVTPPWDALCREVAKLQIPELSRQAPEAAVTVCDSEAQAKKNPAKSEDLAGRTQRGVRDLNPSHSARASALECRRVKHSARLRARECSSVRLGARGCHAVTGLRAEGAL